MGEQTAGTRTSSPRGKRWLLRGFLAVLVLLVAAAIVGACYQAIGNGADARRFPQQGKSVSLGPEFGNLHLNLNCEGHGSPTVILDSGLGVPAIGWNQVQSDVAKFTRVCSYDRAGYGWSDPGPTPRTSAEIAKELHALLAAANEKPPYILVGHSFGGYTVRVYNGAYPSEIAGMVLVDASQEDQQARMPPAFQRFMEKQNKSLARQELFAPLMIQFGITRFMERKEAASMGLPKPFAEELLYLQRQPKFIHAIASEELSFSESASQVRAAGNLGDKPLIVLTAGKNSYPGKLPDGVTKKDFENFHDLWVNDLQLREARLSTRGNRIIVPDSSHMIPFERPDAVVDAVHQVWTAARGS